MFHDAKSAGLPSVDIQSELSVFSFSENYELSWKRAKKGRD
jgi:hypothetical protein